MAQKSIYDVVNMQAARLWNDKSKVISQIGASLPLFVASGTAVVGEVLRYQIGKWILDYNRHSGECSIFYVELWGILDRLALIQDKQFVGVMIQTDYLKAVKAIQDSSSIALNFALI
ncbi:hypothetical protein Gohar_024178 [Gossypium harknessii]|uniref:RNase H type-1 domain-containing protein n=1 Tax=Gossypium harknessii TaxID=34285 RepID=A0A7J9HFJ9_9ROSI|nr:hypothetical protein [Gossypium harknessii]